MTRFAPPPLNKWCTENKGDAIEVDEEGTTVRIYFIFFFAGDLHQNDIKLNVCHRNSYDFVRFYVVLSFANYRLSAQMIMRNMD